jgi:hypothetical protein
MMWNVGEEDVVQPKADRQIQLRRRSDLVAMGDHRASGLTVDGGSVDQHEYVV